MGAADILEEEITTYLLVEYILTRFLFHLAGETVGATSIFWRRPCVKDAFVRGGLNECWYSSNM